MRVIKKNSVTLCAIILLVEAQLNHGAEFNDVLSSSKTDLNRQTRMLEQTISCTYPYTTCFRDGGSLSGYASYSISLTRDSKVQLDVTVGRSQQELQFTLGTDSQRRTKTEIQLFPSDSWPNDLILSMDDSSWTSRVTIDPSNFSLRKLKIDIENTSSETITLKFEITVLSSESNDSSLFISENVTRAWLAPVTAIVAFLIVVSVVCCVICRIRRNRLLRNRMRSRAASDRARANTERDPTVIYQPVHQYIQQPPQNYQQIGPPIYMLPNNQENLQPQNYQQIGPPMYMLSPNNQNLPLQYYQQIAPPIYMIPNNQNLPVVPPIELVIGDPNSDPLTEQNFDHRFPEAPFENFNSSFPQKTCSVCLEDLNKTQTCRQLYCEHIFHAECAKVWLLNQMKKQNHGYCPNCNKNMTFVFERAKE